MRSRKSWNQVYVGDDGKYKKWQPTNSRGRLLGCVGQTRAFGCITRTNDIQTSSCCACLFLPLCAEETHCASCVCCGRAAAIVLSGHCDRAGGGFGSVQPNPARHRNMWWNTHEQIGLNFTQGSMFSMPSLDTPLPTANRFAARLYMCGSRWNRHTRECFVIVRRGGLCSFRCRRTHRNPTARRPGYHSVVASSGPDPRSTNGPRSSVGPQTHRRWRHATAIARRHRNCCNVSKRWRCIILIRIIWLFEIE